MTSLDQATSLLRSRAGLKTEPVSRAKLERLLLEGAERAGIPVEAYVSIVDKQPSAFDDLLDRVTVQHSAFFRDPAQLAALAHLARDTSGSGKSERVVWSAGCGNGQEPYSLAMVLDESGAGDWRVMATDVSFQALARTGEAHYTEREVEGLTGERRRRYLTPSRGGYDVVPSIRNRVRIAHHNLARDGAEPFAGKPDVVFCRNVLMYFEKEEARASIGRIASRMAPGAHLFLGPSDSPGGMAAWFAEVHVAGALCFKRLPGAPATRAMTSRPPAVVPSPHDLAGLLEQGNRAAADGDVRAAVRAFRQATYLDPTVAVAYFQLGAALELAGDTREARRAFAAAGLAMVSGDGTEDVSGLGGYTRRDLATVIAYKLTAREQTS
jgi:chemotaxis methyl-accepting protein methylase